MSNKLFNAASPPVSHYDQEGNSSNKVDGNMLTDYNDKRFKKTE